MAEENKSAIYHIVMFAFAGQKTADGVVKQIHDQQKLGGYKLLAQGVAEKDDKGKVHFHEPGKGGMGTTLGLVTGGLLGLIGGPVGLLAWSVAGGVVGGVIGKYGFRPIDPDDLKAMGDALPLNSSAFLVLVEDTETEGIINSMQGYQANVITMTVGDEMSGEIAQAVEADIKVPAQGGSELPAATDSKPAESTTTDSSKA
jgi:uncharacterized membrane protein